MSHERKTGIGIMNYKDMKLEELADYINKELASWRNFTEITQNDFKCNESTLRKKLTGKKLYERIGNMYVRQEQTEPDLSEEINNVCHVVWHYVTSEVMSQTESQSVTQVENDEVKYLGLINNYELIMQMLEDYKRTKEHGQQFNGLVVELPAEKQKDFRVTLRLNDIVYEEFKEVANANKQFTIKELVSQALKEFIEKYKWYLISIF